MHDMVATPPPPPRISVVFCSHDRVHAGWAYDYGHLIGHFVTTGGLVPETGERFSLSLNWCQTSLLPEGRHRLVEDLKAKGVVKILWIDTDMRFPKEALHMLLRHQEPVVGVNYLARRPPFRFTAATLDGKPLETKPGDTGLVEVGHVGFGMLLTDMSVFEDEGPWFAFEWERDAESKRWRIVGEDVWCCRDFRARGHKVYIDQELSNACGHIGEFEYNTEVAAQIETPQIEPAQVEAAQA